MQLDLVRVAKEQPYPLAVVASPGARRRAGRGARPGRAGADADRRAGRALGDVRGSAGSANVRKTFRLTGKPYELALDLEVQGAGAQGGGIVVLYPGYMPPDTKKGGFFSGPPLEFIRPVCRAAD